LRDGALLLMERWRDGMHYFSIPGGGIEPGETPEQTVMREILEETSVQVVAERQVLEMRDRDIVHRIYLCTYVSGEPVLPPDSPEALFATPDNRFEPCWVPLPELHKLQFLYWQPLQAPLIAALFSNGFEPKVKIVNASLPR
jgi:8-oxo-dGTP pyrophosphatase MutT (NUDIX family)